MEELDVSSIQDGGGGGGGGSGRGGGGDFHAEKQRKNIILK